jgi:pimeloyl-ACP methyl ester carboxylesterase
MRKLLRGLLVLLLVFVVAGGLTFYFQPLWVNDQIIRMHLREQNVQSEYIQVDGNTVHYFEALPPARLRVLGDGTPLVLIHGLGSRGEDWAGMIPGLAAAGFHVYAPDLLGYGRSAKPDVDYSIATEEKIVVDFMKAVHLDRADVAGWSMGGWVALKLTIDQPQLVDRLIVYDSAGIYFPPTFDASLFTPTDSVGVARLTAMLTPHPKPLPAFASEAAVRRLQSNAWVIHRSVVAMEAGRDLLDFRLGAIKQPTLIVWGSEDKLIPPSVGETMHRDIPDSSLLIVDGCGHLAPGECAQPVLAGTLQFLEAHPPVTGGEAHVQGAPK